MLHEGWLLKKSLASSISSSGIDEWYERARKHGAIGGKILGAGGGGFLLLYAHPEYHPAIVSALAELSPVKFRFEPQGSKIVYIEERI
jgi:D-glycero-alpha-D-manno-heptose-7-phosphate kinase